MSTPDPKARDLRHTFERLTGLAKLMAAHQDDSRGWAEMRHSIIRAKVHVGEQMKQAEGRQQ